MHKKTFKLLSLTFFIAAFFGSLNLIFGTKTNAAQISFSTQMPVIQQFPKASDIHYGQSLSESILSGGRANTPGNFTWENPNFSPLILGKNKFKVIFTPSNSNFSSTRFDVEVNLTKAKPIISNSTASKICVGQALSNSQLDQGHANVQGDFSWEDPNFTTFTAGTYSCTAIFTPADSKHYETVKFKVNVTFEKMILEIPKASDICLGQPLSESILSGGLPRVPGKFSWVLPDFVPPAAGIHTVMAIFTPKDLQHYKEIKFFINVNVKNTQITYPKASDIYIGQSLSNSNLSGGQSNIPGVFVWENPDTIPQIIGKHEFSAMFVPTVPQYSPIKFTIPINIKSMIITSPMASDIRLGQPLSSSNLLLGQSAVSGNFSWENPNFIPSNVGRFDYSVVFTPTDPQYRPIKFTVPVNIKSIIIKNPIASDIKYGQYLKESKLSNGWACVPGTFVWENPSTLLNAGKHVCKASFIPDDLNKFKKVNFTVEVTVKKAPVTVFSYPLATPIIYGQKLSEAKIYNALFNVSGIIDWDSNNINEILPAGDHRRLIKFIPDNPNYAPFSCHIAIKVYKANPSLPNKTSFSTTYKPNMRLKDFKLSNGWEWEDPNTLIDFTGKHKFKIFIRESNNYLAAKSHAFVHISKADPTLELSNVTYDENQHLYNIHLPKGWSWNNPQIVPDVNNEYYKATFDPDKANTQFYHFDNNVSVKMKVLHATPIIYKWPELSSDCIYGTDINTVEKIAGNANVPGTFRWGNMPDNLKIGKNKVDITFIPYNKNYSNICGFTYINIIKNNTPETPPANALKNIAATDNAIKLEKNDNIDVLEYSIDGGKTWQDSAIFIGLTPNNTYKIIYRYKNTEFRCTGKNSRELIIKTKLPAPPAPEKVEIIEKTNHKIVLKSIPGLEYSKDGGKTWQDSAVFEDLSGSTEYCCVARFKEIDNRMASPISEKINIKTRSWLGNIWHKFISIFKK